MLGFFDEMFRKTKAIYVRRLNDMGREDV